MSRRWSLVSIVALLCGGLLVTTLGAAQPQPLLVMVTAEREYQTAVTLPAFAQENLKPDFRVRILRADPEDPNSIPGLEVLTKTDVLVLSIRRRVLPQKQLTLVRDYIAAGKPLVGIRTACHAFCLRNAKPPAGHAEWPKFDREILGCYYQDHFGNKLAATIHRADGAKDHPVLTGLKRASFPAAGSLYRCAPLATTATRLLSGNLDQPMAPEPVAWTNLSPAGGRVFFTSLGHPGDFQTPEFVQVLRNGIYWAAGKSIPPTAAKTITVATDASRSD